MRTYLIKIFTKHLQTKFYIDSENEINDVKELNKPIIDNLGKSDIEWEPNPLKFSGTATGAGFYITYEEVNDGTKHNVTLRQENTTGV